MWTIGIFEATTYFATDAANTFTSEQYLAFKFLTCAAMAIVSVIYVFSFNFNGNKTLLVLLLCAYRLVDAFGGYFYAAFQKAGRLDISGFFTVWQSVLSTIAFAIAAYVTGDLIIATVAAIIIEAVWVFGYNIPRTRQLAPVSFPDFNLKAMGSLFIELLPLFIAAFLANYLANIPKYAIEAMGNAEMQTIYNVIFAPSFIINLFLLFIMRPMLTPLSKMWVFHESGKYLKTILKILLAVFGLTVALLIVVYLCGIPVLEIVFNVPLEGCLVPLLTLMLAGGLISASNVLYNAIIIQRMQRTVLIAYGIAVGIGTLVSNPLVAELGLQGAALTYLITCAVLLAVYVVIFVIAIHNHRKNSPSAQ